MYKLCFFVPETHLEKVKNALFNKGAGRFGQYDCCTWQTLGQGQFRALVGSTPFLGEIGKVNKVNEYKVEMLCSEYVIREVVQTLLEIHPYEQPAYDVYEIKMLDDLIVP